MSIYNASDVAVSPITFKDSSITLRHVLALFTPPPAMQGSSAILGTVQLIVSQLRPPFDLQSTWVFQSVEVRSDDRPQDSSS